MCVVITLQVVLRLLLNSGDSMLVEEYTYPHIPESMVEPAGFVVIPIKLDAHGIDPFQLRHTLNDMLAAGKPLPKLLYTVPTGQNPTGGFHSLIQVTKGASAEAPALCFKGQSGRCLLPAVHLRNMLRAHQRVGKEVMCPKFTGAVAPLERKREIYGICREYDIMLLEDDPYYYLQFPEGGGPPKGLHNLGRSYLSMDVDGRVIRLDSFSKVPSSWTAF
jgi:DNA-binding transcriptional MocR family regulator